MSSQCHLFTLSGQDRPGITSSLLKLLADESFELMDMGQAVTYGHLSLSFVIKSDNDKKFLQLFSQLNHLAHKLQLNLKERKIPFSQQESLAPKTSYILTCQSSMDRVAVSFLSKVSALFSSYELNIIRMNSNDSSFSRFEILTTGPRESQLISLKEELYRLANHYQVDMAYMPDDFFRRNKRLVVMDMDSTLIQAEVLDELARKRGVFEEVKKVTDSAMNGEISTDESLRRRLSLLKDVTEDDLLQLARQLPLTPGAKEFIHKVKSLGLKIALISGGPIEVVRYFKDKLGLHYAFGNQMNFSKACLEGPLMDANMKATTMEILAQQEGIHLKQVVAIGDGANDLVMLSKAGLGIAFHAKEIVQEKANFHINHGPMTNILHFLGISP